MTPAKTLVTALLGLGFLAAGGATGPGAAAATDVPPPVTTLMVGWEQKFKLEWQAAPEPGGTAEVRGYIVSRYGEKADRFRVLGRALDASGTLVGQRIAWVPGGVSGFGRSYFVIQHLPAAHHYAVTVWDYTLVEAEGFHP